STLLTGQPFLALAASSSNLALSMFGTFALVVRWILVIVGAPCTSSVSLAEVSIESGVKPASPSCAERAIVKQPACAAAISSSGLVPVPSAKRELNEYCVSLSVPLWVEIVPLPSFRLPFHTADAVRSIGLSPLFSFW